MIAWREAFNIGVKEVDEQHQELVNKLNDFMEACNNRQGKDKIEETLLFLKDYTVIHFRDEEELMIRTKFPDFEEHKKDHVDFIDTVNALINEVHEKGTSVLSTIKLNRTLVDWLLTHISKNDIKIGEHIRNV